MIKNKDIAVDFLNLVIAGQIESAYQKYVDLAGKHHNVFFPAGFSVLRDAMQQSHDQFPHKKFEIKQVIAEGDLVAVHSHLTLQKGGLEMGTVHIFKIQHGKIVEMWDRGQEIPHDMPNQDGAF